MTPPDRISAHRRVDLGGADGLQFITPVTCILDHYEHAVTDAQFALGVDGRYRALCDHLVEPDYLTSPPGRTCLNCLRRLRAARPEVKRSPARTGALRRLWGAARDA